VSEAVFIPLDDARPGDQPARARFEATEIARGPWDPDAQHGGAPAALLVRAFEQLAGADGLTLARLTYELVRPVPLGALEVAVQVVRPGRRVQLLEGTIAAGGQEVVKARALRIRRAQAPPAPIVTAPLPPPELGRPSDFGDRGHPFFGSHGVEIRFVEGAFHEPGPATAWFRLMRPLVAGEQPSPLQLLAAAADFPNGISSSLSWDEYVFINPDLTIYIEREPVGEWIAVEAQTILASGGVGISEGVLHDERGRVGRATQALLVAPRPT
jgi:hypothetical protein